ncbi:hypothetical protein M2161_000641 [Streptomyces sp. SAI-133]|nr:hypothetical protein [Streptomyces sp. SAI-041]MDH6581535.1 hypothetical protein [Streptomyces sp. SAI-133]
MTGELVDKPAGQLGGAGPCTSRVARVEVNRPEPLMELVVQTVELADPEATARGAPASRLPPPSGARSGREQDSAPAREHPGAVQQVRPRRGKIPLRITHVGQPGSQAHQVRPLGDRDAQLDPSHVVRRGPCTSRIAPGEIVSCTDDARQHLGPSPAHGPTRPQGRTVTHDRQPDIAAIRSRLKPPPGRSDGQVRRLIAHPCHVETPDVVAGVTPGPGQGHRSRCSSNPSIYLHAYLWSPPLRSADGSIRPPHRR